MLLPKFMTRKSLGCITTCDKHCNPSGATVFFAIKNNKVYFITHKHSLKAKQIEDNPNVCLVVADETCYEQIQLYATAKAVSNPGEFIPIFEKIIDQHSANSDSAIPYQEITSQGVEPVVIELTPKHGKYFKSGKGLAEVTYS